MKITRITAHVMAVPGHGGTSPSRNWVFVRVDTDEGIQGVGEATTEYHELAVAAMVEHHFGPMLMSHDPTRINDAWQQMYRSVWWRDGVVASSAASGIDQALWDITGKVYVRPVHALLGGAVRTAVPLYARADLGLGCQAVELAAAEGEGYRAFKFPPGSAVQPWDEQRQLAEAVKLARKLRGAANPDVQLMIDCAGLFSRKAAARLLEEVRELGLLFVEEPVNGFHAGDLADLRRAFPTVAVAAGERKATRWSFREWLELGAVDVIQADICHCGGISELLRIAAAAETYGVRTAPHNPYGPVAFAANVHACATMPNFLILEHCRHRPWSEEVVTTRVEVKDGAAVLPESPGLGVEVDWEYVERHSWSPLQRRVKRDRFGALGLH